MVFLHGTAIMHRAGLGKTPTERGKQVEENEFSVHQYETYVPVGEANKKIKVWKDQGAEIVYLSSHESQEDVNKDRYVLTKYGFPEGPIYFRQNKEQYKDIAEKVCPDVLIEDDCKSIGGVPEMTYPHIKSEMKQKIKSIVVKEFEGIDHLPENISELIK